MITERHFWWISLFRRREFRLGKGMELLSVGHDKRVWGEQLSRKKRKRSEGEGQFANLQG